MARHKSLAPGVASALVAVVALFSVPAFAQNDPNGVDAYSAGVKLGRSLNDPRKCGGRGDAYQGCLDGVEESQFDREADQALRSDTSNWKSSKHIPSLSPPPDLFHDPYRKPGDGGPPNQ